ncbi:MAG: methyltransferase domain-containing protein [Actinomycetota bacterium]
MERPSVSAENLRHAASFLVRGRNPAATVYESIGPSFFLALDEGWLNLGLWEGDGSDPTEAPSAVRRLVREIASELPRGGDVLDVGNGLGAQDGVIRDVAAPRRLVAANITLRQLALGAPRLAAADAIAVNADAVRLPFADASFDGVVSVEAAFHFSSRERFFTEAFRVRRPGGVLTRADIPTVRRPRTPREALAGISQLRLWGLRTSSAASAGAIVDAAERAGFTDLRVRLVGERSIGPALRFARGRLAAGDRSAPLLLRLGARAMLREIELLWERGLLDYLLLVARKPGGAQP